MLPKSAGDRTRPPGKRKQMGDKKLWQLTILTDDTSHNDTWPAVEVVSATDEEIAQLESELGKQLYTSLPLGSPPDVAAWRRENAWLFDDDEGDEAGDDVKED